MLLSALPLQCSLLPYPHAPLLNGAASSPHAALLLQAGRQHVLPHDYARDVHQCTTQVVYSLSKLRVPEALAAGPKTADELATELGAFVTCVCITITKVNIYIDIA